MIDKLRKRIFWIIQGSLTIIIVGITLLYIVFSYRDTLLSATNFMERINSNFGKVQDRNKVQTSITDIDGIYNYVIRNNSIIIKSDESNSEIEEIAMRLIKKKADEGIIEKYVYKSRKIGNEEIHITLIENEKVINNVKMQMISAITICIIAILLVYFIANRISIIIVMPVAETLNKQKQFISDASHELKTPLAVIKANSEVLEDKVGTNKWIKYIQNEIQSMNKLVNYLLILAKMDNVKLNRNEKFDLSKQVEMSVSVFESIIFEKNIKLETNIQKDIEFNGDPEDIKRIVSILIDNAIKHTEKENEIKVKLLKEKNEIILEVKNQGEQIPKDEQSKIFERFYRVDKSRNRAEKRYGLGLAIAKQTVEKYNGSINVECKNGITNFIVKI